jgi:alpha/beta superfamily hydrolase
MGECIWTREEASLSHSMLEEISGATLLTSIEVRSSVELPSKRIPLELITSDGLRLIGELALPVSSPPTATLIMLHPLPTGGGFMDSHVYRKAANRLPALANMAVLRFNTRGTSSPHGISEGKFDGGILEQLDVEAAVLKAIELGLPNIWLVGWSFGTELALKYGPDLDVLGAVLLSPPLHRTSVEELRRWNDVDKKLVALIPELDDYLKPAEAAVRFGEIQDIELVNVSDAKHLWVGESATKRVLDEIVRIVNPAAYPLKEVFSY